MEKFPINLGQNILKKPDAVQTDIDFDKQEIEKIKAEVIPAVENENEYLENITTEEIDKIKEEADRTGDYGEYSDLMDRLTDFHQKKYDETVERMSRQDEEYVPQEFLGDNIDEQKIENQIPIILESNIEKSEDPGEELYRKWNSGNFKKYKDNKSNNYTPFDNYR